VAESSDDQYPILDEATRDVELFAENVDSFGIDGLDDPNTSSSEPITDGIPPQIGDYVIRKQIGAGGMGQVFLAEHLRMQRVVAVKTLQFDRMQNATAIERFYDEVRTASRLMHPNIVTAFDAGEAEGVHYLAMEYVAGKTLTQIVATRGPTSVGEAAAMIRQAALGLLHAHRAGIVHRDVKPGNLMRASDGTIKVLDLGLAQIDAPLLMGDSSTPTADADAAASNQGTSGSKEASGKPVKRLIGTLAYMSPEQLEAPEKADARSDIYSLGAVLHFLLTAKPPYTGEYLDVVYGHRHGEIPDLMEIRDDIDLNFANIFSRMMAKSPGERYASLDEVIDDLSDYTDRSISPLWLAEFSRHQARDEVSTASVGSTASSISQVLAIDLGMFYSAAASAAPSGGVSLLAAGGSGQMLMRMALASENGRLLLARDAMELRLQQPNKVVHCLPMYIGSDVVDRTILGEKCPPEALMAILLRQSVHNAWGDRNGPDAVAITLPSVYDQLHRRSIMAAAQIAGLQSVRLVDRSVAAVQSTLLDTPEDSISDESMVLDMSTDETVLFVSVTGQANEVAVLRRDGARLHQLSSAGHWHTGALAWLSRLVKIATERFIKQHGIDPTKSLRSASSLQVACERAMNSLLLLPRVNIAIDAGNQRPSISIHRSEWISRSSDLIATIRDAVGSALQRADITLGSIDRVVTMGAALRLSDVRAELSIGLDTKMRTQSVDRGDVARGAAACLAGELPGRTSWTLPPRCVTSQTIGIVVEDRKGRRRILPIIPRGTALPARTNRRLTVGKSQSKMTLSLVESSGIKGDEWQTLGRYECDDDQTDAPKASGTKASGTRMIGFEVNVNGLLTVRSQTPGVPGSTRPTPMPTPNLSEEDVAFWKQWVDKAT
tara:strand:+ start:1618 stop:4287 length:2670 start_codon:yes stop_codon:yes gene_type:complete